jgi:hypothetical protein
MPECELARRKPDHNMREIISANSKEHSLAPNKRVPLQESCAKVGENDSDD